MASRRHYRLIVKARSAGDEWARQSSMTCATGRSHSWLEFVRCLWRRRIVVSKVDETSKTSVIGVTFRAPRAGTFSQATSSPQSPAVRSSAALPIWDHYLTCRKSVPLCAINMDRGLDEIIAARQVCARGSAECAYPLT